jgi:hypothetical protein
LFVPFATEQLAALPTFDSSNSLTAASSTDGPSSARITTTAISAPLVHSNSPMAALDERTERDQATGHVAAIRIRRR